MLIIKGSGIALANPVYFRLTPLTVVDAIKKGVIGDFEVQNPFSPNRASKLSVLYTFFYNHEFKKMLNLSYYAHAHSC